MVVVVEIFDEGPEKQTTVVRNNARAAEVKGKNSKRTECQIRA
jgi:hypothetical protein